MPHCAPFFRFILRRPQIITTNQHTHTTVFSLYNYMKDIARRRCRYRRLPQPPPPQHKLKVGDFGLSRIKRKTYMLTKTGNGTPQWMAPEILRNEQADEKSDVYSMAWYCGKLPQGRSLGIILMQCSDEQQNASICDNDYDAIQIIGAIGFLNQRLEVLKDVDPQWASLIESCWSSEPQSRPTFQEILIKLKDLQKKFAILRRDNRS